MNNNDYTHPIVNKIILEMNVLAQGIFKSNKRIDSDLLVDANPMMDAKQRVIISGSIHAIIRCDAVAIWVENDLVSAVFAVQDKLDKGFVVARRPVVLRGITELSYRHRLRLHGEGKK